MFLSPVYSNADTAVIKPLKGLSADIKNEAVIAKLDKHPDYPSLLAISDVLSHFKIGNDSSKYPRKSKVATTFNTGS